MSSKVVFTGLYRHNHGITNLSLADRINLIRDNGIDEIYWYVWEGYVDPEVANQDINIVEIPEPFPHTRGVMGRQRQIFNFKKCLSDFKDDDIILKLRWDLDFNKKLIQNIKDPSFFDKVENGVLGNKIWTGFYSIRELFSPADLTFAGFKRDLDKAINFDYKIDGEPANNYISHDGMMLMPFLLSQNKEVCSLIKAEKPDPDGLSYERHFENIDQYCDAWAYSYFLFYKYFKTGPIGTCFFKRGDLARWPHSIVDYNRFLHNYDTMVGRAPKLGMYSRYRVYDDYFVSSLVKGNYNDPFANKISKIINKKYLK
tara:strand:+ start:14132 stop:15073 length:942 start_codon:yes stop_codon:yes gene_type:complete